jgi:cytochrome c554/c'-like protein
LTRRAATSRKILPTATFGLAIALLVGLSAILAPGNPRAAGSGETVILATASNRGEVEQCGCKSNPKGGLARRAALVDSLRGLDPKLLLLDAGGFVHYDKTHEARFDGFVIEAMNQMRYDAVTLGGLELERGDAAVRDLVKRLQSKVVLTNVRPKTGTTPWTETTVLNSAGRRIGVMGLVSQDFTGEGDTFNKAGFTVEDPFAATARVLPGLKAQSDLVVALAHLKPGDLDRLVKTDGKGIDFVIAGFNPMATTTQPDTAVTVILRPGQRGEYLSLATLGDRDPQTGLVQAKMENILLAVAKFREDQPLATKLATLKSEVEADGRRTQLERELKISEGLVLGQDRFLGNETCARCHGADMAWWEKDPHAHAFATLEKAGKATDTSCLPCHVTGVGTAGGFGAVGTTADMRNVQCESCHGIGTQHDWTGQTASAVGEATCKQCHVPEWSPKWNYSSYLAKLGHGNGTTAAVKAGD